MPLEIFAIIVPLGIAFIVLVVKFTGLSKTASLADDREAIAVFESDYAGEKHGSQALLTSDHSTAFIPMESAAQLGLVEAMGDRFITRLLYRNDVGKCERASNTELNIKFNDFTHPSGKYVFGNSDDAERAENWFGQLESENE